MADSFADRWAGVSAGIASGDFDPVGANNSYAFTSPLQPLPALPSTFAPSSTSKGAVVTSAGGAPSTGGGVSFAGASAAMPSNATASATSAGTGSGSVSVVDYFLRAVIIILGFIFVAVGLNMFRPGLIPNPVKALHR